MNIGAQTCVRINGHGSQFRAFSEVSAEVEMAYWLPVASPCLGVRTPFVSPMLMMPGRRSWPCRPCRG